MINHRERCFGTVYGSLLGRFGSYFKCQILIFVPVTKSRYSIWIMDFGRSFQINLNPVRN